jgi:hypothetical protein
MIGKSNIIKKHSYSIVYRNILINNKIIYLVLMNMITLEVSNLSNMIITIIIKDIEITNHNIQEH